MSADPLPSRRFEATVVVESVPPPIAPGEARRLLRRLARRLAIRPRLGGGSLRR